MQPSVYVIGEPAFRKKLVNNGIRVVNAEETPYQDRSQKVTFDDFEKLELDPSVVGVIVGTDYNLSFRQITEAANYIKLNNAELIGTNVDRTDGKDRLRPSGGSIIKIVQNAAGNPPVTVVGKPDTYCFDLLRKQHKLEKKPLNKFLMVGDNLETDILFGNRCGIDTLLVMSGVTTAEKTERILNSSLNTSHSSDRSIQEEGIPTHVQSLLSQSDVIDFK